MKLNLQSLHGNFNGDPIRIEESFFDKSEYKDLNVVPNQCIENSYEFAILNNCKMIEGVLLTEIDDEVVSIEPHCWNKIDERYYDITIDFLLTTEAYKKKIGNKKVKYIYIECVEYFPQDSGYQTDISTFYYNYDCLVEYIQSKLEKNIKR